MTARGIAVFVALTLFSLAFGQSRAWRDINFGMSADEIESVLRTYEDVSTIGDNYNAAIRYGFNFRAMIGERTYNLYFQLVEDELAVVRFESPRVSATDFDSATRYYQQQLVDLMSSSKGEPSQTVALSFLNVRPGYNWTHAWAEDAAGVRRFVGIRQDDFQYLAVLWIEHGPTMDALASAQEEARQKALDEAADDF